MYSNSLKPIRSTIIKYRSTTNSPSFLTNIPSKKIYKNMSISSLHKHNMHSPQTDRPIIKQKYISPLQKNKNNYKKIENYLLSTSLFTKNSNSEGSSFDIEYYRKISKKNSPIINKKGIISSVLTHNIREAYKKNIIIDILKKKREEISKNEKDIQRSFRERKKEMDSNFNNFSMIINEYKTIKRNEEKILNYYKMVSQRTKSRFIYEQRNNKKLKDIIEKTIRDIYKLKEYADFIHKLYNIPFIMDQINDNLFYDNKYDILCEKLINLYTEKELENEEIKKEKLLKDIQLFIQNYNSIEDNIIQLLKEKEIIINDIYLLKNENSHKLKNLILRKNNYKNDENSIINIKNNYNNEIINKIQANENEYMNDILKYIIQIADVTGVSTSKNPEYDTMPDYVKYCKDILTCLTNKECLIDKYTKDIEHIMGSKNRNEKLTIEKTISNRKKYNLTIKQNLIKENKEKLNELNKMNTIKKINKRVIRGKRIIIDYKSFNLHKKKIQKIVLNKNDSDINLIQYFSEDVILCNIFF